MNRERASGSPICVRPLQPDMPDRRTRSVPRGTTHATATTGSRAKPSRTAGRRRPRSITPGASRRTIIDWKRPGETRLQAGRHRQQGRQLPAERRSHRRGRDSAAEPGRAARRRALAEGKRRSDLRRRADAVRGGAGRAERKRHEGPARHAAVPRPGRIPGDHQARQAVHHVLHGAARTVRTARDEDRRQARVLPGERRPAATSR